MNYFYCYDVLVLVAAYSYLVNTLILLSLSSESNHFGHRWVCKDLLFHVAFKRLRIFTFAQGLHKETFDTVWSILLSGLIVPRLIKSLSYFSVWLNNRVPLTELYCHGCLFTSLHLMSTNCDNSQKSTAHLIC